jgi:hypothetical protein
MSRVGASILLLLVGCSLEEREDSGTGDDNGPLTITAGPSGGDTDSDTDPIDDDGDSEDIKLDLGDGTGGGPQDCVEGQDCPTECEAGEHVPCDDGTSDVFAAMGLGCAGEVQITGTTQGVAASLGVRSGFGPTDTWAPREGSAYTVIGSGDVADLDIETPAGDSNLAPTHCNDQLVGSVDPGMTLPAPLQPTDVAGDCTANPALVGTGDCSSTVAGQFNAGGSAFDYTELRLIAQVPAGSESFSYDFAFFSTEYPEYFGSQFNDMYVGWLESESWTGNVSFDEMGNPISLNAGFLDFRDDAATLPEFGGTCMKQHAGTRWLSTTAPVTPGEQITLVMAVFDLADKQLDSYVFLDNFEWGCEGTTGPVTEPVG